MSPATRESVRVDPDGVSGGVVLVVALAAALVMAMGVMVAWQLASYDRHAPGAAPSGRFGAPPSEMNGIEMSLLVPARGNDEDGRATTRDAAQMPPRARPSNAEAARWLHGYGWVDRARGRVHIPIARAMELYVARQADAASAAGSERAMPSAPAPSPASGPSRGAP